MSRALRVGLFDYGAGNLHSLAKALAAPGVEVRVEEDPRAVLDADVLVLPGVGAFTPAAERLAPGRAAMRDALAAGMPAIGICLGMQLLFDDSEEGPGAGLGIIPGRVTRLAARQVPQIGWNAIEEARDPLLDAAPLATAYYANSFVCRPADPSVVVAWSEHEGDRFPAAVRARNVVGVQFHPEKSSAPGLRFLQAFLEGVRCVMRNP
ncbi:MAG TPA: imidazole glycerol phosphate synthase subunit HisH [Gemmatimonadaceae bacterium]|nr:imidazole glycerol phosphate synthase subunit HisH [Gemmatimonadaceae bacterium]